MEGSARSPQCASRVCFKDRARELVRVPCAGSRTRPHMHTLAQEEAEICPPGAQIERRGGLGRRQII